MQSSLLHCRTVNGKKIVLCVDWFEALFSLQNSDIAGSGRNVRSMKLVSYGTEMAWMIVKQIADPALLLLRNIQKSNV